MANTSSKTDNLGPMFLKVGIPLAISAAGGICAIMMAKGSFPTSLNLFKPKSKLMKNENFHSHNHSSSISFEEEEILETEGEKPNVEEVILSIKGRVEDLERKELDIERQFIWYQNLKEREALLVELKNTLLLDIAHINFLEKEILLMEEENKRFESLVTEYLGVSEQLEGQKTENKLLEREVKKLKKRLKDQSKIIREKNLKIEDSKTQLWRNNEEMETKKRMIEKLGKEVKELKMQMDQLQEDKNKALSTSKIEEEKSVTMEDFNKLSTELNQLKDAFEVFKKQEQEQQGQKENPKEGERNHKALDQNESSSDKTNSTRPKLLQRISCVGGNEKMKRKIRPE
ncbi:myosin-10 [Benincasa hispida]|uniref:myosin-10 n=1 Tax=Benincasa hispida TaxID=102211 RepID=UPI001900AE4D|nr:myosin-10 [Benincasa hispida]